MVPAEAAVITKGRPYVGLVVAAAVAVRVANVSPFTDDAMNELREDQFNKCSIAWPSPPTKPPTHAI